MNLNGNPRLENIEVSDNAEFADFFQKIVDGVFSEVKPGEKKENVPDLPGIQETINFPLISANTIKREALNEASYTHTIDH